jgi:hypothetical protein
MNLEAASSLVVDAFERMHALYHEAVFDEWVVISFQAGRSGIFAYRGPRAESFKERFAADVVPLQGEMAGKKMAIGDFEFAPDAAGTRFDACLCIGGASYLICNNTGKSMSQIRKSPHWLRAQKPFVELSGRFRADPLE